MLRINRSLLIFILTVLADSAIAATSSQETLGTPVQSYDAKSYDAKSYDGWYQVEIIVFKPKRPTLSDELWPLENFSYPDNMVSVSASNPDDITPYSLSQLDSLATVPETKPNQEQPTKPLTSSFLFEGRGSHNRALVESSNQSSAIVENTPSQTDPTNEATLSAPPEPQLDFDQADILLDSTRPKAYRSLDKKSFTLGAIARSLRRSSKYDLTMHKAWIQPVTSLPSPILLQTGKRYDDLFEIDGTLSISRSRYLHVQADLWFTQFETKYDQSQFMQRPREAFSELEKNYLELIKVEQNRNAYIAIQSFPLHHSRRMRSSALHYIDHPYFGILIKIEKFKYPS